MSTKLYVGNLPESVKEKDLRELFSSFGEVEEIAVFKGYGFVHFAKAEDGSTALSSLDETDFMGATIQVQVARTKGHGYGRGSGPPRPRPGGSRGPPGGGDSFRRSGRDGYRESYRERERGRYGGGYEYDRYGGSSRGYGGDYYDRGYDRYDRSGGGGYDRYDMRGYDSKGYDRYDRAAYDRYYDDYSGGGRYSDYRARSRSPARDYYGGGGRERGGFEREYGEGYGRTGRKW